MVYDILIVGGGIAGVTAAIYLKMAGLNISIIEKELIGGKLNYISEINNVPGILLSKVKSTLETSLNTSKTHIQKSYMKKSKT